jgi:hypothetical protein
MFLKAGEDSSSRRRRERQEIESGDSLYSLPVISDRLIDHLDVILDLSDVIATSLLD